MKIVRVGFITALFAGSLIAGAEAAQAQTLGITYYTINSNDPDANHLGGGVYSNEVQSSLGTYGLPVLNTPAFGCTSDCYPTNGPTNLLPDGEITYWAPQYNSYVTETGTGTVNLPFNVPSNLFPVNGQDTCGQDGGACGYQALTMQGTLYAPSTEVLNFTIGSDDMAFVYLDGTVVCDDGGVHGSSSVTCTTPTVTEGDHTIDLFFVDINQVQSGLTFAIDTTGVTTAPPPSSTPEPSSLMLLGTGVLGAAGALRRRMTRR